MAGVESIAEFMEVAAITAPKTRGENYVVVKTLKGDDLVRVHDWMVQYAQERDIPGFARDGKNVLRSEALVLIGLKDADVAARATGLIDADFVMGIPLSVSGKSIYFDR
jgi:uncharacterized ferredoxin-like protein